MNETGESKKGQPVWKSVEGLESAIEVTHVALNELNSRLEPVLKQIPPDPGIAKESCPVSSNLAQRLVSLTKHVGQIEGEIRRIIARLEI